VLAGVVPKLRKSNPEALPNIAKGYAAIAWPAMILIVFTGAWGLAATDTANQTTEYTVTLGIKMLLVAGAVIATLIHSNGTSKLAKGLGGAIGLLATLFAAYCGVLLAHVG
jgi:predicted signal transduction protein with EAL and GGDEF domain